MKKIFSVLKKVLFPFYRERHNFLYKKWWFRLAFVIYLILLVVAPIYVFATYTNSESSWCYNSLHLYYDDLAQFKEQSAECARIAKESILPGLGFAIIGTIVVHYLVQLIAFKVVADFIFIGGKERYNDFALSKDGEKEKIENREKNKKLPLYATIILGCLILGGFFYAVQVNKQKSIERQQEAKLEEDKRIAKVKADQDKKEYLAKRKTDCLDIYKTESNKWNNVRGWRFDETDETCYIRFKDPKPKSAAECDKLYPTDNKGLYWITNNLMCKDGEFDNSF